MAPFGIGRGKKPEEGAGDGQHPPGQEGLPDESASGGEAPSWPEREQGAPVEEAPAGAESAPDPGPVRGDEAAYEDEPAYDEQPGHEPAPVAESGAAATAAAAHEQHEHGQEGTDEETEERSRVAVASEPARGDEDDDEYEWHTGIKRPTGKPDAVEFIDVHKSFGRNRILRGLNMGLPEGMISMILGPSGTGKSVCIKHMVGLLYPDDGDVLVHGESVPNMQDEELFEMRKKFGVLFQDGALFGSMNLLDNVAFPLRQHTDKSEEEILEIVNRRLREVGLTDAGDKMPNELSGGMRKRAGFARALVLDPDIVLFDEPDSGLDPVRTALLCELIQEVHAENGGCYTVVTHDISSARRVAEHITVLWKGRIVESGPAEELFNSDNAFVRQFLSGESHGPLGME